MQSVARLILLGRGILGSLFLASVAYAAWSTDPAVNVPVSAATGIVDPAWPVK